MFLLTAFMGATAEGADVGSTGEILPADIVVTATQRQQSIADIPIAVSALDGQTLHDSGATDIRGANQLVPSLLVSSASSEAVGGVARIRGIGTVGDNPGLESSVATFIDGVYRNRSGSALTELGPVDRIEVLRGPQGTLFGRNASAGLINIVTKGPSRTEEGSAELSYGNYHYLRFLGGLTGPIGKTFSYRLDGVYSKRDGFLTDPATGKRYNDRDRFLVRGQLKYEPADTVSVRIIGDYAKRNEQCCAASYEKPQDARIVDGNVVYSPSQVAQIESLLGGAIRSSNPYDRLVSVTPGRDYRSFVKDWGGSAEVDWDAGFAKLTSITAYRDWTTRRGQDADFNTLDLIYRDKYDQRFKTFTQELRLQGKAFGDRLDWLVGGYFASETLTLADNLRFGNDYGRYAACLAVSQVAPSLLNPGRAGCANPGLPTATAGALALLDSVRNTGSTGDHFRQRDLNYALFTHDIVKLTDRVSLTLGARYTHDRKTLDATIVSDSSACSTLVAANAGILAQLACANNITSLADGHYRDRMSGGEWTGTAALSWKPADPLMTYASYSRGYKAGGYNLDRAGLTLGSAAGSQLGFAPEKNDAFEVGAKYRSRNFWLSIAGFYERFRNFQLNIFNGTNFLVENIAGCSSTLDVSGTCPGKSVAGVIARGVEVEASYTPFQDLSLDSGLTYARTRYRNALTIFGGQPLPETLALIPDRTLSNAPSLVVTGGATWTPMAIPSGEIHGLFHLDFRYQSRTNTGSDLALEKFQGGFVMANGRIGLTGKDDEWGIELWVQNLFDTQYDQVVASAPLQPPARLPPTLGALLARSIPVANALFVDFPGEPRTFGVTVRSKF